MEKILEVKELAVSYHTYAGEVQAVRGISFDIYKGEAVAIVGESGCGKSVTSKAIMGLIQTPPGEIKQKSEILYRNKNIIELDKKELQQYRGGECAIIFQDALSSLNPTMKVGRQIVENLTEHGRLSKVQAKSKALELLQLVGIPNPETRFNQYPHEFSGGMRQRAMIAIALACNPNLLIADEPTTALDVTIQAQILLLIKDLQKKLGSSIILITHDLGVVADVADRILVMYAGKLVERGTTEEIFYDARHPYTRALLNAVPRLDTEEEQELESIQGTPPDLISPPKGCGFSQRCKKCMKICLDYEPESYDFGGTHTASCWLYHPEVKKLIGEGREVEVYA